MPYTLTFDLLYKFDTLKAGITIPVILQCGSKVATSDAKVDTGAEFCVFQREIGEHLDLDIESGQRIKLSSMGGAVIAFGHWVTLRMFHLEFDAMVYFAQDYGLLRNLLGRDGWLQKVRLAVVDYDSELYLSPYDVA